MRKRIVVLLSLNAGGVDLKQLNPNLLEHLKRKVQSVKFEEFYDENFKRFSEKSSHSKTCCS